MQIFWLMVHRSKLITYLLKCGQKAEESLDILAGGNCKVAIAALLVSEDNIYWVKPQDRVTHSWSLSHLLQPNTSPSSISVVRHDPSQIRHFLLHIPRSWLQSITDWVFSSSAHSQFTKDHSIFWSYGMKFYCLQFKAMHKEWRKKWKTKRRDWLKDFNMFYSAKMRVGCLQKYLTWPG